MACTQAAFGVPENWTEAGFGANESLEVYIDLVCSLWDGETLNTLRGVATLGYDAELCNGCRRCIDVCPHAVFGMHEKRALVERRDDCMECGACALNCEPGALRVDAGVGCATGMIVEWWRDLTRHPPG